MKTLRRVAIVLLLLAGGFGTASGQTLTILYSFGGRPYDGGNPSAALMQGSSVTSIGGSLTLIDSDGALPPQRFSRVAIARSAIVCGFTINPNAASFGLGGGASNVVVTATATNCSWTATNTIPWITITSINSGTGSGSVSYAVAVNSTTAARSGTMTIAGQTFTVTQNSGDSVGDGIPDWWRARYFSEGGTNTNSVSCATCDADGTGQNNFFKYVTGLDPTNPVSALVLRIETVSGQSNQKNLMLTPIASDRFYTPEFTTDLVNGVWGPLTGCACPQTNGNQITITDLNATQSAKFYRIDISTSVSQGWVCCRYTINPNSASVGSGGGTSNITVTATATNCPWTAASNAGWITITTNSNGVGTGTLSYSVASNTGTSGRTGTLVVAGLVFTIAQNSGDSVGDGIPDWWRAQYFGGDGTSTNNRSCASGDADGTGQNNRFKYLAGLNPTNTASVFRILSLSLQGNNVSIAWQAGGGRTNLVQAANGVVGITNPIFLVASTLIDNTNWPFSGCYDSSEMGLVESITEDGIHYLVIGGPSLEDATQAGVGHLARPSIVTEVPGLGCVLAFDGNNGLSGQAPCSGTDSHIYLQSAKPLPVNWRTLTALHITSLGGTNVTIVESPCLWLEASGVLHLFATAYLPTRSTWYPFEIHSTDSTYVNYSAPVQLSGDSSYYGGLYSTHFYSDGKTNWLMCSKGAVDTVLFYSTNANMTNGYSSTESYRSEWNGDYMNGSLAPVLNSPQPALWSLQSFGWEGNDNGVVYGVTYSYGIIPDMMGNFGPNENAQPTVVPPLILENASVTLVTNPAMVSALLTMAAPSESHGVTGYTDISPAIVLPGSGDVFTNWVDIGGASNSPNRFYRIRLGP